MSAEPLRTNATMAQLTDRRGDLSRSFVGVNLLHEVDITGTA